MTTKLALAATIAALLLAMPARADECSEQLAAVQQMLESQQDLDDDTRSQVENLIADAMEANKDGDEETCLGALADARALLGNE